MTFHYIFGVHQKLVTRCRLKETKKPKLVAMATRIWSPDHIFLKCRPNPLSWVTLGNAGNYEIKFNLEYIANMSKVLFCKFGFQAGHIKPNTESLGPRWPVVVACPVAVAYCIYMYFVYCFEITTFKVWLEITTFLQYSARKSYSMEFPLLEKETRPPQANARSRTRRPTAKNISPKLPHSQALKLLRKTVCGGILKMVLMILNGQN
jgi:hypothetical protein